MRKREKNTSEISSSQLSAVVLFCSNFLLFTIAYFLSNYFKRGTLELSASYSGLLAIFYICWFVASFTGRKFESKSYTTWQTGIFCFAKSALYLAYCIAFAIVILGISKVSRVQVFSTCMVVFVLESLTWTAYCKYYKIRKKDNSDEKTQSLQIEEEKYHFSFTLFAMDFLLLIFAFFTINFIKRGHITLLPNYEILFLTLLGLWFPISLITEKFRSTSNTNYTLALAQWLKAGVVLLTSVTVVVFGLRLFQFSRFQSLGSILLLLFLEAVALRLYFLWRQGSAQDDDIESLETVKKILGQEELHLNVDVEKFRKKLLEPVRDKLKDQLAAKDSKVFEFIDEHVELDKIISLETAAEHNGNRFSLTADPIPIRLFLELRKINDIQRINKYFLKTHQLLLPGGYFISRAHTLATHKAWIYKQYPAYIASYVYIVDFCIHRVIPKLPYVNKIYFALTKGKDRVISRAEVLGRLQFCGFEIVAEKRIEKRLHVIARKIKTPSLDVSPTYGPFVELKRVGFNNERLNVYKLRTMHPYSEYLQEYIFKLAGLKKGGKLEDDFRLTEWGKWMRKLWLDELPMLYNWLKGDLQIVGVRPLSMQYFSLYDKELQELRGRVKPGLVPPFYADLPESFEEICESERRYIEAFIKNPVKTQLVYFFKAFWNIVFRGARSK